MIGCLCFGGDYRGPCRHVCAGLLPSAYSSRYVVAISCGWLAVAVAVETPTVPEPSRSLALSLSCSLADIQSFCAWPVLPCIHSIYVVSAATHVPHLRSRLFFTRRITAPSNPFACNALVLLLLASFGLIAPMPPPYAWVLSLRPSIPIPLSRPLSFLFISLSSSLALVNSTRSFPLRTSSRSSQGKPVTMSRR